MRKITIGRRYLKMMNCENKYLFMNDSKISEQKLKEIFELGGIPSPQDGSFRFALGTISEEYIAEQVAKGYRVRENRNYVEFVI